MDVETRLNALLGEARAALAALNDDGDRTVGGLVDRIGALRFSEGRLVGFLDALIASSPHIAAGVAPRIEGFIAEAIAARLLLT